MARALEQEPASIEREPAGAAIIALADHIEITGRRLVGEGRGELLSLALAFALGRAIGRAGGSPTLIAATAKSMNLGRITGARER